MKNKLKKSSQTKEIASFYSGSEKYLEKIGFFKKLESFKDFSPEEIKQILNEVIKKYFNGEYSCNFVLGAGSIIHTNIINGAQINGNPKEIEKIASITCTLDELAISAISTKEKIKSSEEIDSIIRKIWDELKENKNK
jgi:polynucleotide 5'-kinase involved in rRNA processing